MQYYLRHHIPLLQETADLVTFTEEIFNGNFIFCAVPNNINANDHIRKTW